MKPRQFVLPYSAVEGEGVIDSVSQLQALMQAQGEEDTQEVQGSQVEEVEEEEEDQEPQQQPQPQSKAEYKFAEMRYKNKQYADTLSKVGQALGIDFSNEDELLNKLNDDALGKMAAQQNVPVEVLKRLAELEDRNTLWEQERLKQSALMGFQQLKASYNLSDNEILSFAEELDKEGVSPFVQEVDIINEYKVRRFDEIVQKQVTLAVQQALSKNSAAAAQSSNPGNYQGSSSGDEPTERISSVAQLRALLPK